MAEVVKIIDPDNGSGTDYTSLSNWEAAQQGDLTTGARDGEIAVAKCRSTGGTADTTAVTVDGWTTSATEYIKIWCDPAESYRFTGKWDTAKYRLSTNYSGYYCLQVWEQYLVVDGVQFYYFGSTGGCFNESAANSGSQYKFTNCLFLINNSSGYGYHTYNWVNETRLYNCIFEAVTKSATGFRFYSGGTGYLYNCDFVNLTTAVVRTDNPLNLINCLFFNNTTDATGTIVDSYCATTNDNTKGLSAAGTGNRFSQTFTFTGARDYHLASNDAGAINYGSDLSATFTTDIDGETRPTGANTWDIGADEYVAAGASAIPDDSRGVLRGMSLGMGRGTMRVM
jgi:hypothetical protein